MFRLKRLLAALCASAVSALSCSQPTPQDAAIARAGIPDRAEALADNVPDLIEPRVPSAVAGDSGWTYQQQVAADFDDDGVQETAVLIADVAQDALERPIWEDGHRWQVYVREPDGETTRLYARFLPNGRLTAEVVLPESGSTPGIVLLEQTPDNVALYEFRYRGPSRVEVYERMDRRLDPARRFAGSPRP